ncbi:MAG: hypothetical protein IKJ63_01635 [Clostridia bacterium]|nr:hypothetical protein [Clostridia bacterium]
MKKMLIFTLSVLMLIGSFCSYSSATRAPLICFKNQNVNISTGEEFSADIELVGNPGIISLRFKIIYDDTVLELISVEDTKLLNGFTTPPDTLSSPYTLRWADSLATQNNTEAGIIATLKFRAIQPTETTVTIEFTESRNTTGQKISFASSSVNITAKCEHSFTNFVPDIIANCHTEGMEIAYCDYGCGEIGVMMRDYNSDLHDGDTEIRNAYPATCTADGYTGDIICLSCDAIKEYGSPIRANGHQWIAVDAGMQQCEKCGAVNRVEQPPVFGGGKTGDVDGDGEITAGDARLALRAAVGLENLNEVQMIDADIDKNGEITSSDARSILRASVGLETLSE